MCLSPLLKLWDFEVQEIYLFIIFVFSVEPSRILGTQQGLTNSWLTTELSEAAESKNKALYGKQGKVCTSGEPRTLAARSIPTKQKTRRPLSEETEQCTGGAEPNTINISVWESHWEMVSSENPISKHSWDLPTIWRMYVSKWGNQLARRKTRD